MRYIQVENDDVGAEAVDPPPGVDQRLLQRVLGLHRVAQHPHREPVERGLVAPGERLERVGVALLGAHHQGGLVQLVAPPARGCRSADADPPVPAAPGRCGHAPPNPAVAQDAPHCERAVTLAPGADISRARTGRARSSDPAELAAAVLAHPGVARLDGGPFGTVASFLPGRRRVDGVRIGAATSRWSWPWSPGSGTPLPRLAAELGAIVQRVCGPVAVEVTFSDVEVGAGSATGRRPAERRRPGGRHPRAALA